MNLKTQADLEVQLAQRSARVANGELSATQAFGTIAEWIIQLGQREASGMQRRSL